MSTAAAVREPAPAALHAFWFGPRPLAARAEWFRKDPAFDAEVRARFGPVVDAALAGAWPPAWRADRLASILVLDQLTRNVHRGTPLAFAGDGAALALARALVDEGADRRLDPYERAFVYLPFEHAEDLACQRQAVLLFEALARSAPGTAEMLDYARRHLAVIERFGRFPHRNAILGRADAPGEREFLREPGSRF
jgi:uncharacterized protein (DUF924 family)